MSKRRVSETDFIRVSTLTRLRAVDDLLRGVYACGVTGIPEADLSDVVRRVGEWVETLEKLIDPP